MRVYWRGPDGWQDRAPKRGEEPRGSYWVQLYLREGGARRLVRESLNTTLYKEAVRRAVLRERELIEEARQADIRATAVTLGELIDGYLEYARGYYVKDGQNTTQYGLIEHALEALDSFRD